MGDTVDIQAALEQSRAVKSRAESVLSIIERLEAELGGEVESTSQQDQVALLVQEALANLGLNISEDEEGGIGAAIQSLIDEALNSENGALAQITTAKDEALDGKNGINPVSEKAVDTIRGLFIRSMLEIGMAMFQMLLRKNEALESITLAQDTATGQISIGKHGALTEMERSKNSALIQMEQAKNAAINAIRNAQPARPSGADRNPSVNNPNADPNYQPV